MQCMMPLCENPMKPLKPVSPAKQLKPVNLTKPMNPVKLTKPMKPVNPRGSHSTLPETHQCKHHTATREMFRLEDQEDDDDDGEEEE